MQQALGIEVDAGRPRRRRARCGRPPGSDDFAEFAYEPHGGYGDGHQTALAFAVAARRGGARPAPALRRRRARACTADRVDGRPPGRRQPHRRRPRRPGGRAVVRRPGRRRRRRPARAGPAGPDPAGRPGRAARDRCRSSPTWCRCSTCAPRAPGRSCSATATTPTPSGRTPTGTASGPTTTSWPTRDPEVRPPLPRPSTGPRCRRPTPAATTSRPTTTRSSRPHRSTGSGCAPDSRATATRSRPSVGELMADLITTGDQPARRHRPPRLPLGAFRRGRPAGQPPPLRGRGPDALTRRPRPHLALTRGSMGRRVSRRGHSPDRIRTRPHVRRPGKPQPSGTAAAKRNARTAAAATKKAGADRPQARGHR